MPEPQKMQCRTAVSAIERPPKPLAARVGWKREKTIVCVPYRVAAECGLLLVLLSWSLTLLSYWRTRTAPSCTPPHAHAGVGRAPVAIVAAETGLAWSIDELGYVRMAQRVRDEASEAGEGEAQLLIAS
mgnify:CR=1 FL=1